MRIGSSVAVLSRAGGGCVSVNRGNSVVSSLRLVGDDEACAEKAVDVTSRLDMGRREWLEVGLGTVSVTVKLSFGVEIDNAESSPLSSGAGVDRLALAHG